jgi:tetratricopeptide (TPR) repeat protein
MLAAEGQTTDHFWVGALAIDENRWNDVETVRRTLESQAQRLDSEGGPPPFRANAPAYAAALGSYAALVRGNLGRLTEFESALARLPVLGWDVESPQKFLRYRVGKLLFDEGRTRDAERYFRSFSPYDYFYTTQAELYLGRIAEASGRPKEAVTHYARFIRWWRYADEPLRPQWEEARQALRRLAGE